MVVKCWTKQTTGLLCEGRSSPACCDVQLEGGTPSVMSLWFCVRQLSEYPEQTLRLSRPWTAAPAPFGRIRTKIDLLWANGTYNCSPVGPAGSTFQCRTFKENEGKVVPGSSFCAKNSSENGVISEKMFTTFGALELEFTIGYFPSKKVVAVLWSTEMIYWQGLKLGLPANNAVKRPNCARTAEESKEEKKRS